MAMGRPSNAQKELTNYLKEQCQMMEQALNQLEDICRSPNLAQQQDFIGTIGLLIGKLSVRFTNIEGELGIFDN